MRKNSVVEATEPPGGKFVTCSGFNPKAVASIPASLAVLAPGIVIRRVMAAEEGEGEEEKDPGTA